MVAHPLRSHSSDAAHRRNLGLLRPANHLAGRQVEHDRKIQPAFAGGDVADIGEPDAVGRGCVEPLGEQVRRDRQVMTAIGRAWPEASTGQRADAVTCRSWGRQCGVARMVLEAVQEMLLRVALQGARDDYEDRCERQRQGIEIGRREGRYTGRKADHAQHRRIVALRDAGMSIAKTAEMTPCSPAQVKRVMALHRGRIRPATIIEG